MQKHSDTLHGRDQEPAPQSRQPPADARGPIGTRRVPSAWPRARIFSGASSPVPEAVRRSSSRGVSSNLRLCPSLRTCSSVQARTQSRFFVIVRLLRLHHAGKSGFLWFPVVARAPPQKLRKCVAASLVVCGPRGGRANLVLDDVRFAKHHA